MHVGAALVEVVAVIVVPRQGTAMSASANSTPTMDSLVASHSVEKRPAAEARAGQGDSGGGASRNHGKGERTKRVERCCGWTGKEALC